MNEVSIFKFEESFTVRTVLKNNEPWFVAKDVCDVLGIQQPVRAVENLDSDEVSKTHVTDSLNRQQETYIFNESGLYALVIRSNRKFRKWITSEVLPAIRKTGRYSIQQTVPKQPGSPLPVETFYLGTLRAQRSARK